MSPICDFCSAPADHDKPYLWDDEAGFRLRFTAEQQIALDVLRAATEAYRRGWHLGPAAGDILAQPQEDADAA